MKYPNKEYSELDYYILILENEYKNSYHCIKVSGTRRHFGVRHTEQQFQATWSYDTLGVGLKLYAKSPLDPHTITRIFLFNIHNTING